jgi:hypothetical protein
MSATNLTADYNYRTKWIGLRKSTTIFTEILLQAMVEFFLDTSFAIALSSVTDQNHLRAVELAQ